MVLGQQISAMLDFLESHHDLALGYCSRSMEGRSIAKRHWVECAQILNSISVDCPNKTPEEWRKFYNEYKSKVLKKIKMQKSEMSATGGGPAKDLQLTPLQERLYVIIGRDFGEPLPGVRHNPLTPSVPVPLLDSPSTASYQNNSSFSMLDEPIIVIETAESEEIISMNQETEGVEERRGEETVVNQPQKRRKRVRPGRSVTDERNSAELEAAHSRLERIESRNAEASLKLAEAINNLAAVAGQAVEVFKDFMTSVASAKSFNKRLFIEKILIEHVGVEEALRGYSTNACLSRRS